MKDIPKYCSIEPKLESCTKEEFYNFIENYPNKLRCDFYMDTYSFNDFTLGYWPYSMVAIMDPTWNGYDEEDEYKIARNYKEALASIVKE